MSTRKLNQKFRIGQRVRTTTGLIGHIVERNVAGYDFSIRVGPKIGGSEYVFNENELRRQPTKPRAKARGDR
jgi:hypothetical protein